MGALIESCRATRRLVLLVVCIAAIAACADSGGNAGDRRVSVSDAFALATVTGQPNGAVYFTIVSTEADTLERIEVPDSIAGSAQIHETVIAANGEASMREMKSGVPLDPGTAVTFTPGGSHVMLVDLVAPLTVGQQFDITLDFAKAASVTLPVAVVESAP